MGRPFVLLAAGYHSIGDGGPLTHGAGSVELAI